MSSRAVQVVRLGGLVACLGGVACFGAACSPNTDLTVPPPATIDRALVADVPPVLGSGRLVDWLEPTRYSLSLDIDPSSPRFTGEVTIQVSIDRPTSAFVLHAAELEILSAEVLADGTSVAVEVSKRAAAGSTGPEEELVLVSASRIEASDARLHLRFAGALDASLRGAYRVHEGERDYVFTQFEPSDARRLFPCFDDPSYKVPFDVTVTVPHGNRVFFNTPEKSHTEKDANTTFVFDTSPRMPTYLVAFAIGPLEVTEGSAAPVPLRVITTPGRGKLAGPALQVAAEHLTLLSEYFGTPYPYAKLDLVAVPNFGAGAMENAGLITFREELLLYDDKVASAKTKRDVAMTLAHELAHQWFGNLVTMKWWDDLWLNEGFATFMEPVVIDRWRPTMRADLELLSLTGWVMDFDALSSARAVRNPVSNTYQAEEAFDGITYIKGAAFIRMLEGWLGDDTFRAGVRAYVSEHAWGNASASDLFRALSRGSNQDVDQVAATFLDVPGVPLVEAELICQEGAAPRVKLSQRQYSGLGIKPASSRKWSIPVCVEHGRAGQKPGRDCLLLSEPSEEHNLTASACPTWLLPNADYRGYYRYALPSTQLAALAQHAIAEDALANVGFITNLWALMQSGNIAADQLFELLRAYKGEGRREVIAEVIKVLAHIQTALIEPAAQPAFERFVSALLLPTAKRLGWDTQRSDSEDDRLLRSAVLAAVASLTDDPWMAKEAKQRSRAFLTKPEAADLDTATVALKLAARRGDLSFEEVRVALKAATTPSIRVALVEALGSMGDAPSLQKSLELLRSGEVRSQDAVYLARAASETAASRAVMVAWLGEHLVELADKMPGFGVARMVAAVRDICDRAARAAAQEKLAPGVAKLGRSQRRFDEALESSQLCIDLRGRQAAVASAYLANHPRF